MRVTRATLICAVCLALSLPATGVAKKARKDRGGEGAGGAAALLELPTTVEGFRGATPVPLGELLVGDEVPPELASCQAGEIDLGLVQQHVLLCGDVMVTLSIGGPSDLTLDDIAAQTVLALSGLGLDVQTQPTDVAIDGGSIQGRVLTVGEDVPIGLVTHGQGGVLTQGLQCLSNGTHADPIGTCRVAARAMIVRVVPDLLPSPFLSIQLPSPDAGGGLGSVSDGDTRLTFDKAPEIEGALDADALARAIADRPFRYAACLTEVPPDQVATAPLEVTLRVTLNATGTIADVDVKKLPDGQLPPATDCLIQQLAESELTPPTDGQPATFHYTFTFAPDEDGS